MPAKPKSAFSALAATLPGEADILATVLADLSDHNAKLVYADWLEDRDDPRGPLLRNFVTAYRAGKALPAVEASPWRDLVGLTLIAELVGTALAPKTERLLALARPALTFKASAAVDEELPTGASKFGGRPDLPAGFEWPVWERGPLAFLAQFNLADLAHSAACRELPPTGLLSVFYDSESGVYGAPDAGGWRVIFTPEVPKLVRQSAPANLVISAQFMSAALTFTEHLTVPDTGSPWSVELAIADDEREVYYRLSQGLGHRLLGYAHALQNDVHGSTGIRHLLTIDSDDAPGWMWGDSGLLYFMITEEDFRARRFDRTHFEFQCC